VQASAQAMGSEAGDARPGVLPTKREWATSAALSRVRSGRLSARHGTASGHVVGTCNATKMVLKEAAAHEYQAIVMGVDRDRNRVIANAIWEQEPQRLRRRSKLAVHLAVER
jgi:hypothetical protein